MTPGCTFPRLRGKAKAALVAVEFDEYGGGRADRMHSQLYADLLDGAGMSRTTCTSPPRRSPPARARNGWCRRCRA